MVILELIRALKVLTFMEGMQLLDTKPIGATRFLVIHDNLADRMALCWRWVVRISALSTFDGRIEAYRGDNG